MAKEVEKAFKSFQTRETIGVDQTKINGMIGTITKRAGQVWQDESRV